MESNKKCCNLPHSIMELWKCSCKCYRPEQSKECEHKEWLVSVSARKGRRRFCKKCGVEIPKSPKPSPTPSKECELEKDEVCEKLGNKHIHAKNTKLVPFSSPTPSEWEKEFDGLLAIFNINNKPQDPTEVQMDSAVRVFIRNLLSQNSQAVRREVVEMIEGMIPTGETKITVMGNFDNITKENLVALGFAKALQDLKAKLDKQV